MSENKSHGKKKMNKIFGKMRSYLTLMRVKHYIKNFLIFVPLIFSKSISNGNIITEFFTFAAFSMVCSAIYILNDIRDADRDRKHATKKKRPIASREISVGEGICLLGILLLAAFAVGFFTFGIEAAPWALIIAYAALNIGYSFGLKEYPILDIAILVSGFVIRVVLGAVTIGVEVSSWLYITIFTFAMYLVLGKRRGEISRHSDGETRGVLKYYSVEFLEKNMNVFLTIALTTYSLWCIENFSSKLMLLTIPIVFFVVLRYSMIIENKRSHGDPVEVVLSDTPLVVMVVLYVLAVFVILYFA